MRFPRRTVATKAESKTEMCASACSGQVSTNAPGAWGDIPLLQLIPTFQHPTNRRCALTVWLAKFAEPILYIFPIQNPNLIVQANRTHVKHNATAP